MRSKKERSVVVKQVVLTPLNPLEMLEDPMVALHSVLRPFWKSTSLKVLNLSLPRAVSAIRVPMETRTELFSLENRETSANPPRNQPPSLPHSHFSKRTLEPRITAVFNCSKIPTKTSNLRNNNLPQKATETISLEICNLLATLNKIIHHLNFQTDLYQRTRPRVRMTASELDQTRSCLYGFHLNFASENVVRLKSPTGNVQEPS